MSDFHILGIDPGYSAGGLVVILGHNSDTTCQEVVMACAWQKLNRRSGPVWRVDSETMGNPMLCKRSYARSYWEIIDAIWAQAITKPYHLAVEQPFIARPTKGLHRLIEATGGMIAVFSPAALSVARPRPNEWRKAILELKGHTKAKQAELEAIRWSKKNVNLGTLHSVGHVAEAACIATWMLRDVQSRLQTTNTPAEPV